MKKAIKLIALLLVLVMLTGCGFVDYLLDSYGLSKPLVPFSRMEYTRPDMDAIRADFDKYTKLLDSNSPIGLLGDALDICFADYYHFDTMCTIADIRSCADITDTYYAEEYAFCTENYTELQKLLDTLFYASAASSRAEELESRFFWEGFCEEYGNPEESYYNDESTALMVKESSLISRYREICANATIEVDGEEVSYSDYIADIYDADEYAAAVMAYYEKYNPILGELFVELVETRNELAAVLGFDSYEQLAYVFYQERDYSPDEANEYLAEIRRELVPLYVEIMETNPYETISYDYLSESDLLAVLEAAADRLGGDIDAAFDFMTSYELCDVRLSTKKSAMSFQAYLQDYEAPYLFLSPYGDMEDVISFAHEFGHYIDAYINNAAYETVDTSECFSQAMEFIVLESLDGVMNEEALDNLRRFKMLDALETYVLQAGFAEFEAEAYRLEDLSVEALNELSSRVCRDYGMESEFGERCDALSWIDILHYFEAPFYVITYPVTQDFAMQIYELEKNESGAGAEKYINTVVNRGEAFMDTLSLGEMESPFAPGRIDAAAASFREFFGI